MIVYPVMITTGSVSYSIVLCACVGASLDLTLDARCRLTHVFVLLPAWQISKGHPLGATGLAQCAEICWQLRGEAGKRQVKDARVGLTHNLGLGGAVVVGVYRIPDAWRAMPKKRPVSGGQGACPSPLQPGVCGVCREWGLAVFCTVVGSCGCVCMYVCVCVYVCVDACVRVSACLCCRCAGLSVVVALCCTEWAA